MTRELLLLRHGKADLNLGVEDFKRALKDKGKRAAQRVGVWLATHDMVPETIISSPAERALTTAEKCSKAMGRFAGHIVQERKIYQAEMDDLLEVLRKLPADLKRVMLVGHNPGLEKLLVALAGDDIAPEKNGKLLPTAALAILEIEGDWSALKPGKARLQSIIRAATLPDKFPWPLQESREYRDRPAYYYNQSSVIPYRLRDGELEIMIVRSSQKKHWVVPKGIHEPGLTAQESAAREALEEAGVEGHVDPEPVGNYRYEKWGGICVVDVFTMEVRHIIPESEWEESHRTRQWVTAQEAASLLRQAELGPMVMALARLKSAH